jgi:trk system potassium uptake protein TrkA
MYAVIIGCGLVGSRVAAMLSRDGHNVAVIDKNPEAFNRLPPEFDGLTLIGMGFDEEILKNAGIEQADVFAALTDNDNVNIMASAVAKNIFGVKRAIARVFDPAREKTFKALGLEIVTPTVLGAEQVYSRFIMGENSAHLYISENDIEIMEHVYEPVGKVERVRDIELEGEIRVVAIIRKGKSFLPKEDEILQKGDRIITVVTVSALHKAMKTFGNVGSKRLGEK